MLFRYRTQLAYSSLHCGCQHPEEGFPPLEPAASLHRTLVRSNYNAKVIFVVSFRLVILGGAKESSLSPLSGYCYFPSDRERVEIASQKQAFCQIT